MDKLCKYIDKELDELENKVGMGGKLSRADIEDGKNLAKFKMALLTNKAMEDDGYSNDYHYGRKRDSMGRYSRDSRFMSMLHELKNEAPDDHSRRKVEHLIEEMK